MIKSKNASFTTDIFRETTFIVCYHESDSNGAEALKMINELGDS